MKMESKLIKEWLAQGLKPSNFEFFTNRYDLVIGKLPEQNAKVEYVCPYCKFYEVKEIEMKKNKSGKKFLRPNFSCSKCGKTIKVEDLRK